VAPGRADAVDFTVQRVQDVGTYFVLTCAAGETRVKVRLSPQSVVPGVGEVVGLQLAGPRTCYYQNEELIA